MTTIVAPTGVLATIEATMPRAAQTMAITTEQKVTDVKLLNSCIAAKAGKIIKAETSSEPTRYIAKTIITTTKIASIRL